MKLFLLLTLRIVFALIFFVNTVSAQEKKPRILSYDVLGLAMFCDTFLKAPKLPGLSTLMNTFGNPLPCVEKRISKGGMELVQVDLRDATCFRNKVCPPGTPALTDWKTLLARAQAVNKLAVKYPSIEWWLSAWLEHDIKDEPTVLLGCDVALKGCPTCQCINSPFSGARPPQLKLELHGTTKASKAFSNSGDGASMFDADNIKNDGNDFQHRTSGSDQEHAWWNELNLRCTGEDHFTPPLQRTAFPELWQFQLAALILQNAEPNAPPAPKACTKVRSVNAKNGEIVKPLAERYCNGKKDDGRGNKPLLIFKKSGKKGDKIDVVSSDGKKVGCFQYYGTYTKPGLHRWYMGDCSKQNAWQLYKQLGNEWGFVKLGGGNCLKFNSVRREGVYR
jgi:hypothetical protein